LKITFPVGIGGMTPGGGGTGISPTQAWIEISTSLVNWENAKTGKIKMRIKNKTKRGNFIYLL
jgi:hypothetical protein